MQQVRAATAVLALVSCSPSQIDAIRASLADESTSVNAYPSLERLLRSLSDIAPDVIVLNDDGKSDASLQIRLLRRRQPSVYVAFIGVSDEARCIALLQWGADDAITIGSPTFIPRLQAAARRARTVNAGTRIAVGDIVFDREARRVWCAGREVALTPHEYNVVDCMFWHAPKPVGVDTLADFVWGDQESTNRRTLVQVYMSYVRKKLAKSVSVAIRFSRGSGYSFSPRIEKETLELAKREG
jgi:Response regulators consisting of a CheY-like receiver domain and a winged-helix DNA-binding domain